jgi:hypothetical protein
MKFLPTLLVTILSSYSVGQGIAKITTIQLPKGSSRIQEALHQDINGDGRPDLILSVGDTHRRFGRSLHIHFRATKNAKSPFTQTPDVKVAIPPSVTAFGIGDVYGDSQAELIWFGARGVYSYRHNAPEQSRTTKLLACEFLFQYAHPQSALAWQAGIQDLNGDGLVDLIVPERNGYRIAIQRRSKQGVVQFEGQFMKLPDPQLETGSQTRGIQGSTRGNSFDITLDVGTATPNSPLVDISDEIPTPKLVDWNADGHLDLIAKQGDHVFIWTQSDTNKFTTKPNYDLTFPIDGKRTWLDPSFNSWITDFNRDQRADSILFSKDRDSDRVRTHVMFFEQTPGKPNPLYHAGIPQQLLVIDGFLSASRIDDIDGDGWKDLQVAAWRLDALDQIQGSKTIDVEFYVYLNKRGKFSRRPDLTYEETLEAAAMRGGRRNRVFAQFFGDINGDGIRELLIRNRPDHIKIMMIRKRGGQLKMFDRPLHEMTVATKSRLKILDSKKGFAGLLVMEGSQVLVVTY